MGIGRWFPEATNLDREVDRLVGLPVGADAGLNREQALELMADLRLTRSKLEQADQQTSEYRVRLEEAGLLPTRR